jgi:DNA-binding GntR family transcriptional regulator
MTYGMLRTFFLVAPMICAAVARLAAMNARPDQIAELRDVQGRFRMALAGGDVDGAATVAAAHWTLSRDQIESFVTPPGLDMPLGGERGAGKDSDR